jgi:hypothetical protein
MPRTMTRALSSVECGGGIRMASPETGTELLLRSAGMMSGASCLQRIVGLDFCYKLLKTG